MPVTESVYSRTIKEVRTYVRRTSLIRSIDLKNKVRYVSPHTQYTGQYILDSVKVMRFAFTLVGTVNCSGIIFVLTFAVYWTEKYTLVCVRYTFVRLKTESNICYGFRVQRFLSEDCVFEHAIILSLTLLLPYN